MLLLTINNGTGDADYSNYADGSSIQIADSINVPSLLTLKLTNTDNNFVPPKQSGYVTLYSTKYDRPLFTGFVTNETEKSFLGLSQRVSQSQFQHMEFNLQATSDEWLLNVKSVPFIPAFVNRTMGQILSQLADTLAPGFFDTSLVQDGDIVPYFQYDPLKKWSDLAKEFGDAARYRYKVINRQIQFAPYGDAPLGIVYDDTQPDSKFDPSALKTQVLTVPPVNDAIVIGDTEPQTMWDDYFIGDGFTTNFVLRHQIFNGSTNLLLQDDWTETSFSSSWTVEDPTGLFTLQGGLNAFGVTGTLGSSYVLLNNGLELGGHLSLQHGYFTFTDLNTGLIGAVFGGQPFDLSVSGNCIAAFQPLLASGDTLVASPSGATNLSLQGIVLGQVATPILAKTKTNHQYLLTTQIDAKRFTRYNQIYRTLDTVLGNVYLPSLGDITFRISDYDQTFPWNPPVVTSVTVTGVTLPSFGQYVLLDMAEANLALNYTLLSRPPQALLHVSNLFGPTGAQLPPLPGTLGPDYYYQMGFGMSLATATTTVNSQGDSDSLVFYSGYIPYTNDIPGVGARIGLTSWQPGKAVVRVQDPVKIAQQAVIAGDDGVRTAIFSDLKPIPRISEEAEWAAVAQIADKSYTQYDGSYSVFDYFWDSAQDYPSSGRYLRVHSPQRNILQQNFFVRQVTTRVIEMFQEILSFEVQFGQDLFLEKLLRRFTPAPENVLEPNDSAKQPTLQHINEVGLKYLPDFVDAKLTNITGSSVAVDLGVTPAPTCEVRKADWGWGVQDTNLIGVFTAQTFSLTRGARDQIWYMRQVDSPLNLTDSFDRADANPMGGNWTTIAACHDLRIVSNQIKGTLLGEWNAAFWNHDTFQNDQYSQVKIINIENIGGVFDMAGPVVRASATHAGYAALANGPFGASASVEIWRIGDFVGTLLASFSATINSGDTLRLEVAGSKLTALVNGVVVGTVADATYTWGSAGVVILENAFSFDGILDDWAGGNLSQTIKTSRFTRALRVQYPLVPTAPGLSAVDESDSTNPIIELAFSGDIGNIRGIEIRDFDNVTVLKQSTVISPADLNFTYNNQFGLTTIVLYAYFFNLMWEYSPPLVITFNIGNPLSGIEQAGPNLLVNPSFEVESLAYATGLAFGTGQLVADAWAVSGSYTLAASGSTQFKLEVETNGTPRTGQRNAHIQLITGASIATTQTASAVIASPFLTDGKKCFPVRGDDYYYFGGYARWDGTALPAGVTGSVYFRVLFYDTTGAFVSSVNSSALSVANGAYQLLDISTNVPTTAAYMQYECRASVTAGGSTFSTGGTNYMDARFDDAFVFKAIRSSHASYRPLSNPLTAKDDGSSTEIDIASFTMRAGNTDVVLNSGTITSLAYASTFYVYYDDPAFVGGTVTYNATATKELALFGESRYFVGSILTPISGGISTVGNNDGGSGVQNGMLNILWMTPTPDTGASGTCVITDKSNAFDGDNTTFAKITGTGDGGTSVANFNGIGPSGLTRRYSSLKVRVLWSMPSNTVAGGTVCGGFTLFVGGTPPSFTYTLATFAVGTTYPLTISEVDIPNPSVSPASIELTTIFLNATNTSGSAELRIYEMWLEAVE